MKDEYEKENELENELNDLIIDFRGYPEDRDDKKRKRILELLGHELRETRGH
jgi:hypothetical protein